LKKASIADAKSFNLPIEMKTSFVGVSSTSFMSSVHRSHGKKRYQKSLGKEEKHLRECGFVEIHEYIEGVIEEEGLPPTFEEIVEDIYSNKVEVEVDRAIYAHVEYFSQVHTKYKVVDKKVRPVAVPLPPEAREVLKRAEQEPSLRDQSKIGHKFTEETIKKLQIGGGGFLTKVEEEAFKEMISKHGKAFSFYIDEIGCVDPEEVTPMVIFTVFYMP
jgi:hypothetical protein